MGAMGIFLVIDDGFYLYICKVYSSVFKEYTPHAFVYDIHFSQLGKSECCDAIIDNKSYSPIFVLEEKERKSKHALRKILKKVLEGFALRSMLSKLLQIIS